MKPGDKVTFRRKNVTFAGHNVIIVRVENAFIRNKVRNVSYKVTFAGYNV